MFSYDQFNNLVSARESGFETIFRTTDSVGNLYETPDQSDRIYGAGSRLEQSVINLNEKRNRYQGGQGKLVTKGIRFFYDEEGNLAKKIEPNGDTWSYLYYGNGMLQEVVRPDQSSVGFKYDSFGSRIEKSVTRACSEKIPQGKREKVIKFLWDGNTLFHEWEENPVVDSKDLESKVDYRADFVLKLEEREKERARKEAEKGRRPPDNLITWVFQDDFIPRGKVTKKRSYSIISDYLGTPVEAYDEDGEKVWERELDIYGRVKAGRKDIHGRMEKEAGEKNFIPFRFQGQYEDEETGLYYNRFQYYSPEDECYTQQDPIRLAGGNPTIYAYVNDPNSCIDFWGLSNSIQFDDFNKAMNAALKWLENRGFKAQKPNIIKFGEAVGKPNGMKAFNDRIGFRVEFDERFGAHINVWNGKEKGPHFQFPANEKTVEKIQKHYCKG